MFLLKLCVVVRPENEDEDEVEEEGQEEEKNMAEAGDRFAQKKLEL